jgi:hypothetical protein
MAQRSSFTHGPWFRFGAAAAGLCSVFGASPARADYAPPPESPYQPGEPEPAREPERAGEWAAEPASSTFRFHVGPALLVEPASPGLATALDIGRRAVGARISATWLRAESDAGLSAYAAELWIDFRHRDELHPILAAGAGLVRGGALQHRSAGAGVLRGALEYELPISDADARVGLNVTALMPAIECERSVPWVTASVMIGAGF